MCPKIAGGESFHDFCHCRDALFARHKENHSTKIVPAQVMPNMERADYDTAKKRI